MHLEIHHHEHQGDMSVFKWEIPSKTESGQNFGKISQNSFVGTLQVAMTLLAEDSGVIWVGTLQKTVFCLFQATFCLILGPKCPNQNESILFLVMQAQQMPKSKWQ